MRPISKERWLAAAWGAAWPGVRASGCPSCLRAGLHASLVAPCPVFRNGLADQYGLELPATLVFDHPTSASLAAHLAAELRRRSGSPAADAAAATSAQPAVHHYEQQDSELLRQQLRDLIADVAGSEPDSDEQPLAEAGVDSVGAVELR